SSVETLIHATSPLFGTGGAAASSFFSSAGAAGAAAAAGCASAAGAACASSTAPAVSAADGDAGSDGVASAASGTSDSARHSAKVRVRDFMDSSPWCGSGRLQRLVAGFAGADAHALFEVVDEDLAVADLAGARRGFERLDRALDQIVGDGHLDLHLRQEVDHVLGAAVQLGVALLAAEALDLGDRDALHADRRQALADLVELERLDDCGDQFHAGLPFRRSCRPTARRCPCRGRG